MNMEPGIYEHYKGKKYEVLGECILEADLSVAVMYRQLYDMPDFPEGTVWIRKKDIFFEDVEVDGKIVPRFKRIGTH